VREDQEALLADGDDGSGIPGAAERVGVDGSEVKATSSH
jgi:hypothetical protein